ncbi:Nramp family divalent metal transporter [Bacillus timonensis]|uniref:Nramp family divalent metal transporter n=1 Tax=Bacillus timonensis TaxID=1033734 RepID=UPI001E5A340F|nr:Nramp family divalent metal transporter [Bacillus timonensis]
MDDLETKVERTYETVVNPPSTLKGKLSYIGPGIVVAATGVGAGDLIMASIAGVNYGLMLLWAVFVGAIIKFILSEGIGRMYLATGKTFLQSWHSLGWVATSYFWGYAILFGIIYGAAAPTVCGMVLAALFPGTPVWLGAIISSVAGFILVWFGRYNLLERIMMGFVGLMFITVVGSAIIILASANDVTYQVIPSVPKGSFTTILGLIGGVGGSITLACYGYWLQAKGWKGKSWIATMKVDNGVAYTVTGIFAVAIMIIAAELLFGTGTTINGNQGLLGLADAYGKRFGNIARWVLLVGFYGAVFTSVLGPWHGISYLFADFVRIVRNKGKENNELNQPISEKDPAYRTYLTWMTFPPMLLLLFNEPVAVVFIYGILGAIFMPALSLGLLYLLNSKQIDSVYRNRKANNLFLVLIILLFVYLGGSELLDMLL